MADARLRDRRVGAQMLTLSLAIKCRLGEADDRTLSLAVIATNEALGKSAPATCAVRAVARDWPVLRRNPDQMVAAAEGLFRGLERQVWPDLGDRADLVG